VNCFVKITHRIVSYRTGDEPARKTTRYKLVTQNKNWTSAAEYCRRRNSHLVGIFNPDEQQALSAYLRQQQTAG